MTGMLVPTASGLAKLGVNRRSFVPYFCLTRHVTDTVGTARVEMTILAEEQGVTPGTVSRHLHHLREVGVIEFVERLSDADGLHRGYAYRVIPASELPRLDLTACPPDEPREVAMLSPGP